MRFCQDCINYYACKKQGMDIPDHIVEKHKSDVIDKMCRDFEDRHKRGRWERVGDYDVCGDRCYRCTNCTSDEWMTEAHMKRFAYCPFCGAKMDLPQIADKTQAALEAMGKEVHREDSL